MTIEQLKAEAIKQQDPAVAARIVTSIAAIESDFFLAAGPLSERLMQEAIQVMGKAAPEPWKMIETDGSAILVCSEWRQSRGVGNGDAWLALSEITNDEENDHSWIAVAVAAGPTRLGLELGFRKGLQDKAQALIRNDEAVAKLWELGFVRAEESAALFVPITIQANVLAKSYAENDFDKALAPIAKAVETALAAKSTLDQLVQQVRSDTKPN